MRGGESFTTFGEIRNALASAWEVHFLPQLQDYEHLKRLQNGNVALRYDLGVVK